MELNQEMYNTILKNELQRKGLNPNGMLFHEFRNTLTFAQQKLFNEAQKYAKNRTKEIQESFLSISCADKKTTYVNGYLKNAKGSN